MGPKKILLVCLGNICRSPMAEGVLRAKALERRLSITTDSAGTSSYHAGEAPDRRAQAAMRRHGIDISDLRARPFVPEDFERFDLLLAMDADNLRDMRKQAPSAALAQKAQLIMDHAPEVPERAVPDPYYGDDRDFEHVFTLLDQACDNLLDGLNGHG
ncbi:MAG: low molecular weight protein-tyrosine-phosphatase [Flavobacteriales bacterium]